MKKICLIFIIALIILPEKNYSAGRMKIIKQKINRSRLTNIHKTNINKEIRSAFKKFNSRYYNKWKIKYKKATGMVEQLYGFHTEPFGRDFKQAGRVFLKQNNDLFKIDTDSLQFINQDKVSRFVHVSYKQYYKDIPVENSIIKFSYLEDGRLIYLRSRYVYDIDLATIPNISAQGAVAAAFQDLNPVRYDKDSIKTEIVIYFNKQTGKKHLSYKVSFFSQDPLGAYIYYIDALNQTVIDKIDILIYSSQGNIKGKILPEYYNDTLSEEPIKNANVKIGVLDTVTSDSLGDFFSFYNDPVSTSFEGPNFKVINHKAGEAYYITNSPVDPNNINIVWDYNIADTHMDELNVFYHLERMRSYFIDSFGKTNIDYQTVVYVHNTNDDLNAYFYPSTGDLYFGDASSSGSYENFAHTADVIYHEYTHAIVENIYDSRIINLGEHGAINEAYADYFACSFLNDPIAGDNCVPVGSQRNLIGANKSYPVNWEGEVHDDSLIFSQALWEIRGLALIGSNNANQLIYNSLYFEPDSFNSGIDAILMADDNDGDLSNGTPNDSVISQAFLNHGLPVTALNFEYAGDTFEPNNGYREATNISLNEYYESYIYDYYDLDYYKLSLLPRERGVRLEVNLFLPAKDQSYYYVYDYYVFDKDKKLVSYQELFYYNKIEGNRWFITQPSLQIAIEPPLDEIYYILVTSAGRKINGDSYTNYSATKSYKLQCTLAEESLADVRIYPNPYKPNDNKFSTGTDQSGIIFQRLTENAKLKVFDLKGRLIFQKDDLGNNPFWEWDVKDNDRRKVPSGIYIYILTDTSGKSVKGKFAVIR